MDASHRGNPKIPAVTKTELKSIVVVKYVSSKAIHLINCHFNMYQYKEE